MNNYTYGSEIEAADWDTRKELPEGSTLDKLDYTIVNSSGLANCPKKQMNVYGGEVNTRVADSPEDAVDAMMDVYNAIAPYTFNYTCNLHIHVGIPDLANDLDALKRVIQYIRKHERELYDEVLPAIPRPDKADKPAMKRFRQRNKSHRHTISETIYQEKMAATTVEEFRAAHGVYKNGKFAAFNAIRCGVNTNSLWKSGTVEFRHFTASDDPAQLLWCFEWCKHFLDCALNRPEVSPLMLLEELGGVFNMAEFPPFDHKMDEIFQLTHFDKSSRKVREERYTQLLNDGVITRGDFE